MNWFDPVRDLFGRGIEGLREFPSAAAELLGSRRKGVMIALGALVLALLAVVLAALFASQGSRSVPAAGDEISRAFEIRPIPAEELFLPGEPDFLPGVVPERERREVWTAEDAAPFWTDPMDAGPELYVESIRKAVDEMMERIP
jgi:hypothetical protein